MQYDYTSIKKRRKELNITQKQLADRVGVSSAYIQQLENGIKINPSLQLVYLICEVLEISPKSLLNEDTLLLALASDRVLNSHLFKELDFKTSNYLGSILDCENIIHAKSKLLKDLIKLNMFTEKIPEENITWVDFKELSCLITEYIKIKSKVKSGD